MGRTGNQLFDEVVLVNAHSLNTTATTVLGLKLIDRETLNVAIVGERDNDVFFLDQVFILNVGDVTNLELGPPLVAKLTLDL